MYEMKRLGRDAAELTALADHGLVLEMLAGPLAGIYDPTGHGRLLFAFFAAMAETERENIRESTLEGLDAAARKGKHGGRPPVITDDMLHTVLRRRAGGETVEQIQPDLIIPTGRRKGQNPSLSNIYRALAEHEKAQAYPEAVETAHADFPSLQQRDLKLLGKIDEGAEALQSARVHDDPSTASQVAVQETSEALPKAAPNGQKDFSTASRSGRKEIKRSASSSTKTATPFPICRQV